MFIKFSEDDTIEDFEELFLADERFKEKDLTLFAKNWKALSETDKNNILEYFKSQDLMDIMYIYDIIKYDITNLIDTLKDFY